MLWFFESFFPVVWIAFLLYWRMKATGTKTAQRIDPAASRIVRSFGAGAAVTIVGLLFAV